MCNLAFVLMRSEPNRSLILKRSGRGSFASPSSQATRRLQSARIERSLHTATYDTASLKSPRGIWEPFSIGKGSLADAFRCPWRQLASRIEKALASPWYLAPV